MAEQLSAEAERLRLQAESYAAQRRAQEEAFERDLASVAHNKAVYEAQRAEAAAAHEKKLQQEQEELRRLESARRRRHEEVREAQSRRAEEGVSNFMHDLHTTDDEADRFDDYLHNIKAEQYSQYFAECRAGGRGPGAPNGRPSVPLRGGPSGRLPPPQFGSQAALAVKPGAPELPPEEREVKRSLDAVRHAPLEARKRRVKELLVQWHPDKHPQSPQKATRVFQYLQGELADGTFLA
jgi:chromosome segregation ATPase